MIRRTDDLAADVRQTYDALVDVRSPSEFAEDHLPGAINLPVLDDAQRAEVGTLFVQRSKFLARRLGASYVGRNIADHLDGPPSYGGGEGAGVSLQPVLLDGLTGSGKTDVLGRLARLGVQTLDLEALADHRGSLFGATPTPQPSQKAFESRLYAAIETLDVSRPVVVEAESSRIGQITL